LTALSASLALADDFKTVSGKEYKNATVSRVEADGIVIRTKGGISRSILLNCLKTFRNTFIIISRKMRMSPPMERQRWHNKIERLQGIVLAKTLINSLLGMVRQTIRPFSTRISPCCRMRFITPIRTKNWRIRAAFVPPDGPAVRMEYSKTIKAGVNATIQDYELHAIIAANTPPRGNVERNHVQQP
jgi:hypothetical protein